MQGRSLSRDAGLSHRSTTSEQRSSPALGHRRRGPRRSPPGLRAATEAGAIGPLAMAGLRKDEVRALAKKLGLPTWDLPAEPCLSSRVPYGERVDAEKLRMIEAAEATLRAAGHSDCRVRHHTIGDNRGTLARIEVPRDELPLALENAEHYIKQLRAIGYREVTVDLAGLRSGGGNALLTANEKTTFAEKI